MSSECEANAGEKGQGERKLASSTGVEVFAVLQHQVDPRWRGPVYFTEMCEA
jgi:hypothetical protein